MTPADIVGRSLHTIVAIGLVLLLPACGGTRPAAESDPEGRYRAAIADARQAEPSEISTSLTPLVPYNETLVWRTTSDSTRQVLVVTWGRSETLPQATPGDTVTSHQDVWVTAVPRIRQFCRNLDRRGDALRLRLAQRLGLPPDVDYDQFVELWVRPKNLVRPCPDPEVTDRECELRPPQPEAHIQISDAHRDWFQTLKRTSYGPDGYPFTGLGYTYDWSPTSDEVGPSEFVLRTGHPAVVEIVTSTATYCGAN